ncbi:DUF6233 domain-containing protein [Streptomyces sp. NPDC056192]|uniref:DUF6233 domain-containing protein n=1 Tax=Streptomyces sp. NPDC056192 TaxID=3345743 RepID=UPI0035DBA1BE
MAAFDWKRLSTMVAVGTDNHSAPVPPGTVGLPTNETAPRPGHSRNREPYGLVTADGPAGDALADGIRACIHCRPDTELGVLG